MKDPQDNGKSLLEDKRNLALLLYLDFFNPFTRAIYSSGALCMTVLNLPRGARFQKKWSALLIGIIPGPEGAQDHVNSFLNFWNESWCLFGFYHPLQNLFGL